MLHKIRKKERKEKKRIYYILGILLRRYKQDTIKSLNNLTQQTLSRVRLSSFKLRSSRTFYVLKEKGININI